MLLYSKGLHKSMSIGLSMRGIMVSPGERIELVVIHDEEMYRATGSDRVDKFLKWLDNQLMPSMNKGGKVIVLSRACGKVAPIYDWLRMNKIGQEETWNFSR